MSMNVNTTGTVYGSYQNTYKAGTVDKKKETAKNEEKAEVKMVANDLYVEPLNPTQAQIEAYNKLSLKIF